MTFFSGGGRGDFFLEGGEDSTFWPTAIKKKYRFYSYTEAIISSAITVTTSSRYHISNKTILNLNEADLNLCQVKFKFFVRIFIKKQSMIFLPDLTASITKIIP